jgi:hypothetical protein
MSMRARTSIESFILSLVALTLLTGATLMAAPPPTEDSFDARRAWLIEQFRDQKIRGHQKTGIPDAFTRLVLSDGKDAEALEYLSKYPVKSNEFFDYPWLARALHSYGQHFSPEQIERLRGNLARVTDWLDHGTENHAAMRVASGYLFAQYFPDATWRAGKRQLTSQELMAEAKQKILDRGRGFYRIGNNEQLSTTYALLNAYPMLGLYDFAEDPEVRQAADALLLYHAVTVAVNNFDGHLMPPFNRRNRAQWRFAGPELKGNKRYLPVHHTMSWLLWGQNQVIAEDFTSAAEPPYAVFFAVTTWRAPEAVNRIARGEGTPYELRSTLSAFNQWGQAREFETLRYVYRDQDFAIGTPVAHRFSPGGFYLDYHLFNIVWKSDNRLRALEAMHPYWRSNHGEDLWKETHSPFQQFAAHRNTAIMMCDIPQADPWATQGAEQYWIKQRDKHADDLMKLAQVRFPASVEELTQEGDVYFFKEADVYISVRVLQPGHQLDSQSVPDYHVIKSRAARTGFVFEVGTAKQHGDFATFRKAITENPVKVDWDLMEAQYRDSGGTTLRMRMEPPGGENALGPLEIRPSVWIDGEAVGADGWPILQSPVATLQAGVLRVGSADEQATVDWSGALPQISRR